MLSKGIRNQYFATICANLSTLIYGLSIGWLSPNLELLLSADTPLSSGVITRSEAGWIGSIGTVGCVLAVLICGWVAEIVGRKAALMLIGVTQLASWVVVLFASDLTMIYTFRILGGFAGGGTFSVIPLFVSEISEDRIRGTLGAILSITMTQIKMPFRVGLFNKSLICNCTRRPESGLGGGTLPCISLNRATSEINLDDSLSASPR